MLAIFNTTIVSLTCFLCFFPHASSTRSMILCLLFFLQSGFSRSFDLTFMCNFINRLCANLEIESEKLNFCCFWLVQTRNTKENNFLEVADGAAPIDVRDVEITAFSESFISN